MVGIQLLRMSSELGSNSLTEVPQSWTSKIWPLCQLPMGIFQILYTLPACVLNGLIGEVSCSRRGVMALCYYNMKPHWKHQKLN